MESIWRIKSLETLPGEKKFLFNVYLPKQSDETTELDAVMIHESGIYVFESKNYSGWIFGSEDQYQWTQTLPNGKRARKIKFYNPVKQNKAHIEWLLKFLGDETLPVHSYIVFSERCELKNIQLNDVKQHVLKRNELFSAVQHNVSIYGSKLAGWRIEKFMISSIHWRMYQRQRSRNISIRFRRSRSSKSRSDRLCPAM